MKVILLQDVPKLGESGTIQDVSDGFARNYLIPQGLAEMGTAGKIKNAQQRLDAQFRRMEREEESMRSYADKLEGQRIEITANVGEGGRLYGSITASDIAEELQKQVGEEVDRRKVVLEDPIRSVGEHEVEVHVVGRLRPKVTVVVHGVEEESEDDSENSADASSDPDTQDESAESTDK